MNLNEVYKELQHLDQLIEKCRKQLDKMPSGKLIVTRDRGHAKWFISTDGHKSGMQYLPKSERPLAEKLACKRYLTCVLDESLSQKKSLSSYLNNMEKSREGSLKILANPEYQKLLKHSFTPLDKELEKWSESDYLPCPNHPENLKYPSPTGHVLRSKSEVIIDTALAMYKIPFRYEAPLTVNNDTYYPDFTIRHSKTGDFIYWEHFGLIDQTEYFNTCMSKLRSYLKLDLVPGINLITTYETNRHPLSPLLVDNLIHYYCL